MKYGHVAVSPTLSAAFTTCFQKVPEALLMHLSVHTGSPQGLHSAERVALTEEVPGVCF